MARWALIGWHVLAYVLFTLTFVLFTSEPLVAWIFPGTHNVELWLDVVVVGAVILFLLCTISFFYWVRHRPKCRKADRADVN